MTNNPKAVCASPYGAAPASRRQRAAGVPATAFALRVYGQCKGCAAARKLMARAHAAVAPARSTLRACALLNPSRTRYP